MSSQMTESQKFFKIKELRGEIKTLQAAREESYQEYKKAQEQVYLIHVRLHKAECEVANKVMELDLLEDSCEKVVRNFDEGVASV